MSDINNKIGAVLITGGGIAGIQASLDLAEMGFYVYLVDKNPALGGRMAQLDKVFPTNDCSMCIISPKLNEVGGHINIKTINCAEILDVQGESGNFLVKILQKPRYLDITKCTACGDCAKVCPVDLPSEFNLNLNTRKVPYKSYAQAYPNEYSLTKGDLSPCVISCPAHVNAHAYMSLAAQGRFQEALEVILDILPLPEVLGRICTHPCELNCRRGLLEGPLAIREIKRLIATKANLREAGKTILRKDPQNDRVAIIGAGPAGLTCAYHLARHGIKSTIFEASNVAGGALRLGIPNYRLPENTLQKEIDFILHFSGTEIKYNTVLGEDITLDSLFSDGFSAIFLALGAHEEARLNIPGADLQGVISG
ncbi:MAG: FAD-dependent oxidoreductase, partial [Deltaproteobacteria bacterium]|nr:FAD-dependent oxidoreductase [Deltaproteobacteria bacterium]